MAWPRSLRIAPGLVAVLVCGACGASIAPATEGDDAVTSIPRTSPRDQKETGNCWLYATAAWAESLERAAALAGGAASEPAHFAPAYWDYWDWYAKITTGGVHGKTVAAVKDELDSGGSWGSAVELALARGFVREPDFVGDAAASDANATTAALKTLAASLTGGPLSSSTARRDGALVRRELERAFRLGAGVAAALTGVFGADGRATRTGGARARGMVLDAADIVVLHPRPDGPAVRGALREARDVPGVGTLAAGTAATPEQEEAALAEDAKIVFFRAKDSYYDYRTGKRARIGYSDLYVDYLTGSVRVCPKGAASTSSKCHDKVPLEDVTFPPGF